MERFGSPNAETVADIDMRGLNVKDAVAKMRSGQNWEIDLEKYRWQGIAQLSAMIASLDEE